MEKGFTMENKNIVKLEQQELKKKINEDRLNGVSAEEYDQFVLRRERREKAEKFANVLAGLIDNEKKYCALELGSGTGIFTNELNKISNIELTCLDMRQDLLEYGINKGRLKKEQSVVGDFEKQPFKEDSFDLLTGMAIMNQRKDLEAFFTEIKRVLKNNGLAFFPRLHNKKGTPERESALLETNGFKIINTGEDYFLARKSSN